MLSSRRQDKSRPKGGAGQMSQSGPFLPGGRKGGERLAAWHGGDARRHGRAGDGPVQR
jgi:hypothetical protein